MGSLSNVDRCKFCGIKFVKNTKWHDYCSDKCKTKGWILDKSVDLKEEKKKNDNKNNPKLR